LAPDKVRFISHDGSSYRLVDSNPLLKNTWYHVVVVVDQSDPTDGIRLYIDGILRSTNSPQSPVDNSLPLWIGRSLSSKFFKGMIDDVRMFKKPLTQQEIDQIYQDGLNVHTNPPSVTLNSPLQGETGVSTSPTLSITANDNDGDTMDISFFGGKTNSIKDNFTIIALPDTQYYSESYPYIFTNQTQWIVNNKDNLNIVFVTHEGDIVEHGEVTQEWDNANASMSLLDGVVPYGLAYGNHDDAPITMDTINYNTYFNYTRFEGYSWYGGHYDESNDNNYQLFSAGGMDFIIIHLADKVSGQPLIWANQVLASYPNRRAIVVSHFILDNDGTFDPIGANIFNSLKDNPNLFLLLCGHVPGDARRRFCKWKSNTYGPFRLPDYRQQTERLTENNDIRPQRK